MIQLLAGTAILSKGKILLLRHIGDSEQNEKWGPPAGHAEVGENPEETAIRETKEETNLDVKLKGIVQVSYLTDNNKEYVYVFYLAEATNIKNLKVQKNEVSDYTWASSEEIEGDRFEFRGKFLKDQFILALKEKPGKNKLFKIYKID